MSSTQAVLNPRVVSVRVQFIPYEWAGRLFCKRHLEQMSLVKQFPAQRAEFHRVKYSQSFIFLPSPALLENRPFKDEDLPSMATVYGDLAHTTSYNPHSPES